MENMLVLYMCVLFVSVCLGRELVSCPDLWTQFQSSCYYLFEEHKDWVQANQVCMLHNGHLVTINTHEENTFLELLARKRQENIWIGASDSMLEGDFRWVQNDARLSFTDWEPGQPDNWHGEQNCVVIQGDLYFHWDDISCHEEEYYICEISNGTPVIG